MKYFEKHQALDSVLSKGNHKLSQQNCVFVLFGLLPFV